MSRTISSQCRHHHHPPERSVSLSHVLLCAVIGIWLLIPLGLPAQTTSDPTQTTTETSPPATTPEEPEEETGVITGADIAPRASETLTRLREAEQTMILPTVLQQITDELPEFQEELARLSQEPESQEPELHSAKSQTEIRQQWIRYQNKLDGWETNVDTRSRILEESKTRLLALRDTWQQTRLAALDMELPSSIIERVDQVLAEIDLVESKLRDLIDTVLTLQNAMADMDLTIAESLVRVDKAILQTRQRIFYLDNPPLWKVLFKSEDPEQRENRLDESWQRFKRGLEEFWGVYEDEIYFHLALFVVLFLIFLLLLHRSRGLSFPDESQQTTVNILSRPLAASVIMAVHAAYILYPNAPVVVADLVSILLILPMARLVPILLPQVLQKPAFGFLVMLFFVELSAMVSGQSHLKRLLLLAVATAALIGIRRLCRPGGGLTTLGNGWRIYRWLLSWVVGTILAAALVWNLLGGAVFAELLTWATFTATMNALLLYAALRIFEALNILFLRSRFCQSLNSIRKHSRDLLKNIMRISRILVVFWWFRDTLDLFQVRDEVLAVLSDWLNAQLVIGNLELSLLNILLFILTIWVTVILARAIRYLLEDDILPRAKLTRGGSVAVSKVTNYTILIIGFMSALSAAGLQISQLAFIFGALGVGIGFGLQGIVNNFVSGLILIFERPIHMGDTIEVGTLLGQVTKIGIRASTVRTFQGAEVIVPNGNLISNEVINWTLSDRLRRIDLSVGVAYGTDPDRVLEVIVAAANTHEKVLENPETFALFKNFSDSSLDFELRLWTRDFDNWRRVSSQVMVLVNNALKQAGITIPFPQRDLHVRSITTGTVNQPEEAVVRMQEDEKSAEPDSQPAQDTDTDPSMDQDGPGDDD